MSNGFLLAEVTEQAPEKVLINGEIAVEVPIKIVDNGRATTAIALRRKFFPGLFLMKGLFEGLKITVVYCTGNEDDPLGSFEITEWSHQNDEFKARLQNRLLCMTSEGCLDHIDWKDSDPNKLMGNSVRGILERIYNSSEFGDYDHEGLDQDIIKKNIQDKEFNKANLLKKVSFRGVTYSIKELAKHLGIKPLILCSRISKGWPENRWDQKNNKLTHYFYKGKRFESISALADYLGIRPAMLRNQINKGLPPSKWGKPTLKHEIIYQGQSYPSISALAEALGVNPQTLRGRIKRGWPQSQWGKETIIRFNIEEKKISDTNTDNNDEINAEDIPF